MGVRFTPMLDADPEGYLRSDAALEVCAALQSQGNLLEVLAPGALFDAVAELAQACPNLPVVLAHFGLPDGTPDTFDCWRHAMARLARFANVHVKVSGLPLSGDPKSDGPLTDSHLAAMLDLFGTDRLMYASNWPVATALASPGHWRCVLDAALDRLDVGAPQRDALYHQTAVRLC